MSRCFPFPPPGYEKKIPITDSDLLKKEKRREEKHKKEKVDKETKDKNRSDGKSRNKKDKKEKNREKKKEKDGQTDNPIFLSETRHKVLPEGSDGQIVIQKNSDTCVLLNDRWLSGLGYKEENHGHYASLAGESNGVKFMQDVDKKIRDDTKRGGGQMGEKIIPMHPKRNDEGGAFYQNSHLGNNFEDSNLALELDWRLKNEAEQPYDQNQTANKLIGANQKHGRVVKSISSDTMERDNNRITGTSGRYVGDKSVGIIMVPRPSQGNHDRMPKPSLGSMEVHERINHQDDELQQRGKKRKDKDRNGEKKSRVKDKSRDKERKEDNGNSRVDQNKAEQGTRESHKTVILYPSNNEMFRCGDYNSNTSNVGKLNQAKELLTNGISHVTGTNTLSRSSLHLHSENGRAPEPRQIPVKPSPDGQGATTIFKADTVGKVNGRIETLVQVVQARPRSLHPDAKRLVEILSAPKIEEFSAIDDSDWLFSSKKGPEKKQQANDCYASASADKRQVWSKATNLEAAGVYVLPYVIPY